ncbi:quinone-dependent dihydroorotate dehydrogenase [Spirosoma sp. KCTC 42546]|uniref:quinone-dependent dihydroorotate dehydrogenase n=1 Tax=Spirosoma sp. KCTC 42546 TaxID=2520506 RepID=UPI00115A54FF|nr:quinone-dependent dihydroorotate dehydrogenase [Spirosoma sp. KCTC 42546]QDK77444.1 quinone-dependent dihydroorotate dehydrogenase [Spirosoma sp. KCTC 42546]
MYKRIILPILFRFDAETIHHTVTTLLKLALAIPGISAICRKLYVLEDKRLNRTVFGLTFPNPIGMAAGFDKNADLVSELSDLGFGFVEIGTVTPRPQPGNDRPRLFRLKADGGLINRMGFNNKGVGPAAERLRHFSRNRGNRQVIVGGNIGKNKDTPNESALTDYLLSFRELFDTVDYFVVNVSSPNTPGLRDLQEREPLTKLLTALQQENHQRTAPKPILLKIAPDLTNGQLDDIISIVAETGIAGVIATNTTISRAGLRTSPADVEQIGAGGVSGQPLRERSTEVIRYLHQQSGGTFPIIGVGGIASAEDAQEKLQAGASLVQVYTSFIYEGPGLAKRINKALIGSSLQK